MARGLIDQRPLLGAVLKALRADPGAATAGGLVTRLADFPLQLRNKAINLLASRPDMALVLLNAVDQRHLEPSLISPVMLVTGVISAWEPGGRASRTAASRSETIWRAR